jgi:signal transduction histidine kinase/CheY-like chemotaxis protein/HPt (histidine-containing phosphotransfer) domain-containing protein
MGMHPVIFRRFPLVLSIISVLLLGSCGAPTGRQLAVELRFFPGDKAEWRQAGVPMEDPHSRDLAVPNVIGMPPDGAVFWLSVKGPEVPAGNEVWLVLNQPSTASEFWVDGVLLDRDGAFPPSHFINSGKNVMYRIPSRLVKDGQLPDMRLRMFSDGGETRIPFIGLVTDPAECRNLETINFFSIDLYRYLAFLSCFMFVFFLVQYVQRTKDLPYLFFAFFNLFISGYYIGLGNLNLGLPFVYSVGLTRGLLFLALASMVMFCLSFTKHPSRLLMFGAAMLGLALFGNLTFLSHDLARARKLFSLALIPSMAMVAAALVYLFRLHRDGMKELRPLLLGGTVAMVAGLYDTVYAIVGVKPLVWLQGMGIFVFLLSVFMTIIERINLLYRELEGYTFGIEDEVKRRTRELHATNIALSKANTTKSEFLAHMSHEIRTPLNCIMGFGQMLEQNAKSAEDRHNARLILEESEHLMQLINHVLDYSRMEQGALELDKKPFNLVESVTRVLEGFSAAAKAKGLQIELLTGHGLPEFVTGDVVRFQQILINILGNAIKFTERGFVRLEVNADKETAGYRRRLAFNVVDSGIGIPEDRLGTVFNSFEQADTSITRKFGGSGLGLSIARELILLMGGEIMVESRVGQGTSINYWIELPVSDIPAGSMATNSARKNIPKFEHPHTILVVEDYPTNMDVIRLFLANAGLRMVEATSGTQALEIISGGQVDVSLILMDLHMPELDGFETTRQLRKMAGGGRFPVIALTADAFEQTRLNCLQAGMQAVLTKPVRYLDLLACIDQWITRKDTLSPTFAETHPAVAFPGNEPAAPVDMGALNEVFFDDRAVINQLVDGFVNSGAELMLELANGMGNQDFSTIHLKAHALKGGALNICAPALAKAAESLEQHAKTGESAGLQEKHDSVVVEWRRLLGWSAGRNREKSFPLT